MTSSSVSSIPGRCRRGFSCSGGAWPGHAASVSRGIRLTDDRDVRAVLDHGASGHRIDREAVDQPVAVTLVRREHPGERRGGEQRLATAGPPGSAPGARVGQVGGHDRERDHGSRRRCARAVDLVAADRIIVSRPLDLPDSEILSVSATASGVKVSRIVASSLGGVRPRAIQVPTTAPMLLPLTQSTS